MKVIHKALLKELSQPGLCEWCNKYCSDGLDPHHIFSRGAGRVDIRKNLVSLCRTCHSSNHNGKEPTRVQLLLLVSVRERTTAEEIIEMVQRIRADDKCKVWEL